MARFIVEDHYAALGIARGASVGEVRRAFRRLALETHPDRAGAQSTATFQRISEAYGVLSDPARRASYDERLAHDEESAQRGAWTGSRPVWDVHVTTDRGARARAQSKRPPIERLSGALQTLLERGLAGRRPDGSIEVLLEADEAARGGSLAWDVEVRVTCPTCHGTADRRAVWCMRCEYEATVAEVVHVVLDVPTPLAAPATLTVPVPASSPTRPLRVLVRART